ncbi:hypothetical protein [Tellurirhabdus bombi]|uniref:hypothetical protein n=1 Tax=Tellurirhabdus bombi TaxID=2907205 RepID=UPI001F36243C|nr:hypothetical protein [Tellurirhabdus bombi]
MNNLKNLITSVVYQLYANALLKSLLLAVSVYLLVVTFTNSPVIAGIAGVLGLGIGIILTRLYQYKKPQAISIIHQQIGDTEYSLALLDKEEYNIAERLQLDRLAEKAATVRTPTILFSKVGFYGILFLAALAFHFAYPLIPSKSAAQKSIFAEETAAATPTRPAIPAFQSATLQIQPPAYTALPAIKSADLNATAITGSVLKWQLKFSNSERLSVRLVNSRGEELNFRKTGGGFEHTDGLLASGLYAIKAYWRNAGKKDSLVYQSDYYRLEAKPDLAPKIEPKSKELYSYHLLKDKKTISISAKISDDFKVSQAFIVATLARGSGENVKFREVRIPLSGANYKEAQLTKIIDLKAFNFTPGDELYYYWAAVDNKKPEANFTKSDTYFIVYKDTTKLEEADLATMAVNVMPEYFRSQRQIIIDTEKLIAKRKKISSKEFNSASNEIGFDQKVLRLRYGQYLGEEFENSIGGSEPLAENNANLLDGFVHKHDSEGEHGEAKTFAFKMAEKAESQQAAKSGGDAHGHSHGDAKADNSEQDPLAALMEQYVHSHDDGEANTFYEQSTKSLLKASLEQMWQSELHLRLYEPEKALPFERKALELLKAAQQKARTYVKKTSLDPPPIKEKETRLTGEMINVNYDFKQEKSYDAPRIAQLSGDVLGFLEQEELSNKQKLTVQQLSTLLANGTTATGLPSWSVLRGLQKLVGDKTLSTDEKRQLKTKLYTLAGSNSQGNRGSSTQSYTSERNLEKAFWRHLK